MSKSVSELKPNDIIKVGTKWWRIRYFYYREREMSIDLQREYDLLSYYTDSTCFKLSINNDLDVKFEVKDTENEKV